MSVARMGLKIIGSRAMAREMKRNERILGPEIRKNLQKAGEIVIGAAKKEFKGERTRALYRIKGGKPVRRAKPRPVSSPSNKLGVFEGTYRKSITQDTRTTRRGLRPRYETEVGPTVVYAARHEFGRKMPKREVLAPAVKKTERQVFKILGRSFKVTRI